MSRHVATTPTPEGIEHSYESCTELSSHDSFVAHNVGGRLEALLGEVRLGDHSGARRQRRCGRRRRRGRARQPVVVKLAGDAIAHKTERGLVRLRLGDRRAVESAARDLLGLARPEDGEVAVLVAPMVSCNRELIAGLLRDPQFGATVMLGWEGSWPKRSATSCSGRRRSMH